MTTELSIGRELGGYRIEALIGRGGMGVVYRAEDLRLGRKVALKVLAPELVENEAFRARFDRESRLAAAIDHPNIIPLYEAREVDGLLFITMRYVEGTDLRALLFDTGRLSPARALEMVSQVAGALDAAHQRGLVHRDVKPANVLVATGPDGSEHCYLTDFGLTKDTSSSEELTEAGQFVGTIEYVAPEQIESNKPDGRADLYALACLLYECLTGAPPFTGDSDIAVMYGHLQGDRPLITSVRPELPEGLDHVMTKALARAPEDRYATCAAFVAAVRAELDTAGLTKVSPAPGGAGSGAVAPAGLTRIARADVPRTGPAGEAVAPTRAATPADREAERAMPRVPVVVVAVLAAVLAAVVGVLVGKSGGGSKAAANNVAAAGSLRLHFPNTWQTARDPQIPGLKLRDPVTLAPRKANDAGLVAGGISDHDARLLPSGLASRLPATPQRDAAKLGDAQAFRFRDLKPNGYSGVLTLYVVPTSSRLEAVACYAPTQSSPVRGDCDEIAASLSLAGATPLDVLPSSAYAKALTGALDALATARASGRKALGAANTAKGQVAPATSLAAAYAKGRKAVSALHPPPLAAALNRAVAKDLGDAASAYTRMAAAAGRADGAGFAQAKRAVTTAEAALRRALDGLVGLGYSLKT